MKRRLKTPARRMRAVRRHRARQRSWLSTTHGHDQACVNANVLYTDPFLASGTAVWLEPEAHGESTSPRSHF